MKLRKLDKGEGVKVLPENVDPQYRDRLGEMLERIPEGWGAWLGTPRGWDKIIAELGNALAYLVPDYEIHQIKEKFGGLRFYWEDKSGPECQDKNWAQILDEYRNSPEGKAAYRRYKLADKLVEATEILSGITCEICGCIGATTRGGGWVTTRCDEHAETRVPWSADTPPEIFEEAEDVD